MSAYLSFYKDKEINHHLFTICRVVTIVEYFTDNISNLNYEAPQKLTIKLFERILKDVTKDLNKQKQFIGLMLIKKDYEPYDVIETIEEYEELLMAVGMLRIIEVMMTDNKDILYLAYG